MTLEGEAQALERLPRQENSDVRKSIIRTTIKNENLLAKKMERSMIKKQNKKVTSTLKSKTERSSKLEGVLSAKIQQSIDRARYVQGLRKAGWDEINKGLRIRNLNNDIVDSHIGSMEERLVAEKEQRDNAFEPATNTFAVLEEE